MKFFGGVWRGQRTNRLHFGGDPDHGPDPEFLSPDHDPDAGFLKSLLFTMAISIERDENKT